MKTLTIFTPTYNRAKLLARVYKSLLLQTCMDFKWLIIDDGSEDNTKEIVESWIEKNEIEIEYIIKKNEGKHTAYNLACKIANSELLFIALDSDDILKENAVEMIIDSWNVCKNMNVKGMVFLCEEFDTGKLLIEKFDDRLKLGCSPQEAFKNSWFRGEAEYILKTEYVKQFLYPVIPNEKFFTEAYTYFQMEDKLMWFKESIYIRDYQQEGLSKKYIIGFYKNPVSYAMYNNLRLKLSNNRLMRLKYALYYDIFSILSKNKKFVKEASNIFGAIFMYLPSFIGVIYLSYKYRKEKKK